MDGKIASASSESELGQQLRRAAKIARVELPEEELQGLLKDAQAIFEKFSEIGELNLSSATMEPGETAETPLREDEPPEISKCVEEILGLVPKKEGRLVKAPKSL